MLFIETAILNLNKKIHETKGYTNHFPYFRTPVYLFSCTFRRTHKRYHNSN